ncbi:MAG: hypothetical protein EOO42_13615 [Flavobacteriales bacterium]|nr:MAG: hypothetical protein EOO42_13615 [Flavobacteriales bacterium]
MNRLLFAISLLISASAFAQTDGNYNYSVGIKGYSLMQMPKILQQSNANSYTDVWLHGGMIKFNDNQIAFRISGHYFEKKNFSFANQCDNCETASGNLTDYTVKLGFEKNFNYAVVQPYFAADFGYRASNFKGKVSSLNTTSSLSAPYNAITSKSGGTFSPTLGLKINVHNRVSLFAESSIEFYYAYERQETILDDAANTRTFAKYNKMETLLNPVSLGIQFHLVGKN